MVKLVILVGWKFCIFLIGIWGNVCCNLSGMMNLVRFWIGCWKLLCRKKLKYFLFLEIFLILGIFLIRFVNFIIIFFVKYCVWIVDILLLLVVIMIFLWCLMFCVNFYRVLIFMCLELLLIWLRMSYLFLRMYKVKLN